MIKMIVGLGNPGEQYRDSRHNVGFWLLDELAAQWGVKFQRHGSSHSLIGQGVFQSMPFIFVKPQAYMNRSGPVVAQLMVHFELSASDLFVILDDIFLRAGTIRYRLKGSSGGHKGLQSIIEACGTREISRLRIGVGFPESRETDWAEHVLNPFKLEEMEQIRSLFPTAYATIGDFMTLGAEAALKRFNDVLSRRCDTN